MSSTFSNLKFELITTGEQSGTWGSTTNTNLGTAVEQAIVGMATLTSANFTSNVATLTLTNTNTAQNARALCLNIAAGAVSAAGTINVPAIEKPYLIINGSSFTVTVKVTGLTGVAVPAGKRTVVYNNGTDVGNQIDYLATLALGTALPVTSGGTGTTTPAIVAGTNVTVSGTWPNQTINATGGGSVTSVAGTGTVNGLTLTGTVVNSGSLTLGGSLTGVNLASQVSGLLPVANGGTATATPSLVAGSNITITGTWPNQTVTAASGPGGTVTSVTGTAPVVSSGGTTPDISMAAATTSVSGYLTSTDWNTFNGKQAAGSYVTVGGALGTPSSGTLTNCTFPTLNQNTTGTAAGLSSILAVASGGTGTASPSLVAGTNITISGTWPNQTVNAAGGGGGTVTSVTGTAPVVSSGGTTPAISMAAATTSVSGYLTSTDWNTFNGKQAAGSYVTAGGALGTPSSGTLTNCTFPTLNQNTTGTAAGLSATLAVASGGTGVTSSTGSGSVVLSTSPSLTTPVLGTPSSGNLTNCTFPTLNQNTTGSAGSLVTTGFSIVESGGKLFFKYGATNIASLDSSGNFIALLNVTAYGTP